MVGQVLVAEDGLTRVDEDDERRVDVAVTVVVTDRRLLFLAGANPSSRDDAGSLDYADVAAASVEDGVLELSAVDGAVWRIPLADADSGTADGVGRHLAWIGHVRGRVVATKNDVDLGAGEIRDSADAMDWETADETYARVRDRLDETVGLVQRTQPVADDALAPQLTEMERQLESAYATLAIERANSRLTLAQQLVANEDHERARAALESARADYETACDHALAVRRGDDFLFGEQRELTDRLERLEWEIQAVAAEPLRQAHEAKILARSTDDPDETVEQWETAYRRYSDVLALGEGDDERHFAGNLESVREARANAAGQLIAIRGALARSEWDAGVECHRQGDTIGAILQLDEAVDHQARATEIAREFRPEAAEEMAERLAEMEEGLARVRRTGSADRSADAESPDEAETDESVDSADGTGITASELADLDTHTEITFDDGPMVREESASATPPTDEGAGEDDTDGDVEIALGGESDDRD